MSTATPQDSLVAGRRVSDRCGIPQGCSGTSRRSCVSLLVCPVCGQRLADLGRTARCASGHSFDFAKAGYLNLAPTKRRRRVGDSADMVAARERFLSGGHLAGVAQVICDVALEVAHAPQVIAELGAGTAYFIGALEHRLPADRRRCLVGIDLSTHAARAASRGLGDSLVVVADVEERIPLGSGEVDLLLSVFAPRPAKEIARVLKPGGDFIVAFARPDHLWELRRRWKLLGIHPRKIEHISNGLGSAFSLQTTQRVAYDLQLSAAEVLLLLAMGPNARHTPVAAGQAGPERIHVSVSVARFTRH
jgi:23S rRNA (guanine745-N1)-methyltransferase